MGDVPLGVVTFRPIGIIRTPFADVEGMPIQATAAIGVAGRIELDPDLVDGTPLLDIKQYVPAFDDRGGAAVGWFAARLGGLGGLAQTIASGSRRSGWIADPQR